MPIVFIRGVTAKIQELRRQRRSLGLRGQVGPCIPQRGACRTEGAPWDLVLGVPGQLCPAPLWGPSPHTLAARTIPHKRKRKPLTSLLVSQTHLMQTCYCDHAHAHGVRAPRGRPQQPDHSTQPRTGPTAHRHFLSHLRNNSNQGCYHNTPIHFLIFIY